MNNSPILHPAMRQRLVRFCGMLGSDHDGERANAARMADRLIREAGLAWENVIALPPIARPEPPKRPAPPPPSWSASTFRTPGMERTADVQDMLRQHRTRLTQWEVDFLGSITGRDHLSFKQQGAFDRIRAKIAAATQGAA